MRDILLSFQKRLTNLSGNNRSLVLLKLLADQFIDLHELNFVNGSPSWDIVDAIISRKSTINLIPVSDPRDEHSNKLSNRFRRLQRRVNFINEESGSADLYVGWPFVEGKFNNGSIVKAPLCFFPVELSIEKNQWVLSSKKEVNISFNKSLLLAFAHYNEAEIKDELVEFAFDGYDKESTAFKNLLYETLRESPINIRFGREFYGETLEGFHQSTRKDFEQKAELGELDVTMNAVLGIFPQADSYLVPDYDYLIVQSKWETIDDFFISKSAEQPEVHSADFDPTKHFLNKVKEQETITPFKLDAYQENAINAVKKGNSIVVEGPPGTGKSQLICNLASDFIARGKKVLIVSQKRAALDVVYERLKSLKVEEFTALVHDFKGDRKAIYDQISKQIESLQDFKRSNSNLDALQLERAFKQASLEIEEHVSFFDEYKHALFEDKECGLSVKELYLTSNPDEHSVSLVQEYNQFHFESIHKFTNRLDLYLDYAFQLNVETHPWSERVSFAEFKVEDLQRIQGYLDEIPKEAKRLIGAVSEIIEENIDFDSCRTIADNLEKLKEINSLLKNEAIYQLFIPMVPFANEEELLWLQNTRNLINACFLGDGIEKHIPSNEIGEIQQILKQRSDAKNTFWKSMRWRFSKEKMRLARVLVSNQLSDDRAGLKVLTSRIDNRLNLQHQVTKMKSIGWVTHTPTELSREAFNDWFNLMESAVKAKTRFRQFSNFKEYFALGNLTAKELRAKLKAVGETLKDLPKKRSQWNKYILPRQIDHILLDEEYLKNLRKTLRKDFDILKELDKIKSKFTEAELGTVNKLVEENEHDKEAILKCFDNSIRLAWIDHLENKYPELRSVSTLQFEKSIDELQQAVEDKTSASGQILLQQLKERTYEGLEFNRLNNQVTYRDLLHQTTKKKKIWPLRRLITHFEEELFKLVPCWLASPESVSVLFPMESLFDLVIFDEASQCFAEKGLPAIHRGKQVVIAGDSKQLQPNDLYRVRWEDEEEIEDLEVESLLDLGKRYLMSNQLQGHYRSESLSLIDFSNTFFYDGKLKMTPDFRRANDTEPAIHYIKVNGVWEKQTNQVEAQAVVDLVKTYQRKKEELSIGVVTFNAPQQNLIYDLLEEENAIGKNSLFVKNIENVQGDERDIIIFSTGYAKDKNGKFAAQFGWLNKSGGEHRLNVAVTRAKKKIHLVTSINMVDLKVEESKNEGPKLLKKYLNYAKSISDKSFEPSVTRESSFEQNWYLKNRIKDWDKELPIIIDTNTPYGDLSLMRRSKYIGLFFTDDDYFFNSISSKEVCVYRPVQLQDKNWPLRQLHSRDYWLYPDKMKDKINRFIEQYSD